VSRYGLLAFASSLDQIGPLTRNVGDAALALSILAGPDPMDSTCSRDAAPDFLAALTGDVKGVRVGVPRAFVSEGVEASVRNAFDRALDVLREIGATLVDVDLPHARYAIPVYYLVCTAEASSNLARYDGVKYGYRAPEAGQGLKTMYSRTRDEGFGPEVKRRIMLGTYVLSAGYYDAFYLKAQQVRTLLRQDYARAFESVEVVAMPTTPTPPFRLGEKTGDPLQMYLADIFTVSVNLVGLPGISIPCGFADQPRPGGSDRLPVGLQIVGRMFDEPTVLRVADAYERATAWSTLVPAP
jgi:aspartyl-tRNA(Asn)/glutamyl-tRNA(Gln) amidotransferase subunit A